MRNPVKNHHLRSMVTAYSFKRVKTSRSFSLFFFFFFLSFLFILKEFILIRLKKKMSLNATFMFVHLGEYGYKWPSAESERCSINQAIYKIEDFLGWKWPFNFWMMNTFSSMDTYIMSYFSLTAAVKICGCSLREKREMLLLFIIHLTYPEI